MYTVWCKGQCNVGSTPVQCDWRILNWTFLTQHSIFHFVSNIPYFMGMQEYISSTHISSAWGLISKHLQCWICIESRSFSHRIQNESNCCFGRMQRFIWNNSEIHHVENIWLLRINGIGGWPNIYQIFSNNLICSYYCPLRLMILYNTIVTTDHMML